MSDIQEKITAYCKEQDLKNQPDILDQIAKLTEDNNVIESFILGAQYLKHKKLENIFKSIQKIQEQEGSLPYLLKAYRVAKYNEMLKYAKEKLYSETYEKFYMSF
jgi:hypothetical protein